MMTTFTGCALLVEQLHLVLGLDVPLHSRLLKVLPREVVGGHLVAILAMRTPPSVGPDRGKSSAAAQRSLEIRCRLLCRAIGKALQPT